MDAARSNMPRKLINASRVRKSAYARVWFIQLQFTSLVWALTVLFLRRLSFLSSVFDELAKGKLMEDFLSDNVRGKRAGVHRLTDLFCARGNMYAAIMPVAALSLAAEIQTRFFYY